MNEVRGMLGCRPGLSRAVYALPALEELAVTPTLYCPRSLILLEGGGSVSTRLLVSLFSLSSFFWEGGEKGLCYVLSKVIPGYQTKGFTFGASFSGKFGGVVLAASGVGAGYKQFLFSFPFLKQCKRVCFQ
jgi:hypothetical protein